MDSVAFRLQFSWLNMLGSAGARDCCCFRVRAAGFRLGLWVYGVSEAFVVQASGSRFQNLKYTSWNFA